MDNILFPKKRETRTPTQLVNWSAVDVSLCVLCVKPMLMHAYILGYQVTC